MKTVLVVEDDPLNWRVFQRILTRVGGFAAKHTEDVEEVMQIVQAGEADIILMDVSLCNSRYQGKAVNGLQITQLLKANAQTAKVPVILLTAHAMKDDRKNLLNESGADGYITKPVVNQQEFVDQIWAMLPKE